MSTSSQGHQLVGQVAIVTGGGHGLGRGMARALAAAGASVAVVGRNEAQLAENVDFITGVGGRALAVIADVTDPRAVARMVTEVEQKLGGVDLLVNNAGIAGTPGPLWVTDADEWWHVLEVNLRGAYLCTRAVMVGMVTRHRGRIINVASAGALVAVPNLSPYGVSKAALVRLTECIAAEGQDYDIRAFAIDPGSVRTDMTDNLMTSDAGRTYIPWYRDFILAGGAIPAELSAELVVKLASGQLDHFSGRFVQVSEGADPPVISPRKPQTIDAVSSEQALLASIAAHYRPDRGATQQATTAFDPEITRVLTTLSQTAPSPSVAARATRTMQALTATPDGAPALVRLRTWLTLTWRLLADRPMGLVWRALWAGLGAFVGIGLNTYFTFRSGEMFNSDRWKLTVSIGLFSAVIYAALVLFADELPSRLRSLWPWWARLMVSALFGLVVGTALWALWTNLYLNFTLDTNLALFVGAGAGIGYVASAILDLPVWMGLIVTAIATYIPLYATFTSDTPVLYYDYPQQIFTLTIPVVLILALGGYAPRLLRSLRRWWSKRLRKPLNLTLKATSRH